MSFTDVMAWLIGGVLAVSALLVVLRIVVGPTVLDRVVATDTLVSVIVATLAAHAAFNDHPSTLPLLISLSLIGFMGSVAVARFVARDRDDRPEGETR